MGSLVVNIDKSFHTGMAHLNRKVHFQNPNKSALSTYAPNPQETELSFVEIINISNASSLVLFGEETVVIKSTPFIPNC